MVMRTYYPPPPRQAQAPAADRIYGDSTPVRHGYTVAAVARLAHASVYRAARSIDRAEDQRSVALCAIIHELHAHDCDPGAVVLMKSAQRAVQNFTQRELSNEGYDHFRARPLKGFVRYWRPGASAPFDERVTERVAIPQILGALTQRQYEVVQALVECGGDQKTAAVLLGVAPNTISNHLRRIRAEFLGLWFEHETPPTVDWSRTTFVYSEPQRSHRAEIARRSVLVREERLGRPRLTAEQCEQIRERHRAGEPQRAIAAGIGKSRVTVANVLSGKYIPSDIEVAA